MVLSQLPDQSPQSQVTAWAGEDTASAAPIAKQALRNLKPVPCLLFILISPPDDACDDSM
jgi:hypothetical protein